MPRVAVPSRRARAGVPPWETRSPASDAPPPGPELTALLGEAVGALGELDERQLLGAGTAARRLQAYAGYLEIMSVAKFGRRRAEQLEASKARGDRVRSRDGEYPAEELGFEMTASAYSAGLLLDMAANIAGRLPSTLAGMAAGRHRPGPRPGHQQRHPPPVRRPRRRGRQDPRRGRPGDAPRGPAEEGGPARGPPRPRGRRSGARTRRGTTGGSSCAGRTPGRRACQAGSSTRPRRWRGRRRSTPRRSGSATRACPAPSPRSGRPSCWTASTSAAPGTASPRRPPSPNPTTPTPTPATPTSTTTPAPTPTLAGRP